VLTIVTVRALVEGISAKRQRWRLFRMLRVANDGFVQSL